MISKPDSYYLYLIFTMTKNQNAKKSIIEVNIKLLAQLWIYKYQFKMEENQKNLFTVLYKGQIEIAKSQQRAILLMGPLKGGKSTLFNQLTGRPMVGNKDIYGGFYENIRGDKSAARVSRGCYPETQIPNVCVDFLHGVTLIDTASYGCEKDYIGSIARTYFLKEIFESIKQIKIMLVIKEDCLLQETGYWIIKYLNDFFKLLKVVQLDEQKRRRILKSVALVISQANKPQDHDSLLKKLISNIKDQRFFNGDKQLLINLLQQIVVSHKLSVVQSVVEHKQLQNTNLINALNSNNQWKYFDAEEVKETFSSFQQAQLTKIIANLTQREKDKYESAIKQRFSSLYQFHCMFFKFANSFFENWDQLLHSWNEDKKIMWNQDNMNQFIAEMMRYVRANNYYELGISQTAAITFTTSDIAALLYTILRLEEKTQNLSHVYYYSDINGAKQHYLIMLGELSQFFKEPMEYNLLFANIEFVTQRGCKQFKILLDAFHQSQVHDLIRYQLKDKLSLQFLDKRCSSFIDQIATKMDSRLITQIFNTRQYLDTNSLSTNTTRTIVVTKSIAKINLSLKEQNFSRINQQFPLLVHNCSQFNKMVIATHRDSQPDSFPLQTLLQLQKQYAIQIIHIINKFPNISLGMGSKVIILKLCRQHQIPMNYDELFENWIQNAIDPKQFLMIKNEYALHCVKKAVLLIKSKDEQMEQLQISQELQKYCSKCLKEDQRTISAEENESTESFSWAFSDLLASLNQKQSEL